LSDGTGSLPAVAERAAGDRPGGFFLAAGKQKGPQNGRFTEGGNNAVTAFDISGE
jgi:hypothetical protein